MTSAPIPISLAAVRALKSLRYLGTFPDGLLSFVAELDAEPDEPHPDERCAELLPEDGA